jgi:hypothetical protein
MSAYIGVVEIRRLFLSFQVHSEYLMQTLSCVVEHVTLSPMHFLSPDYLILEKDLRH